MWWPSRDEYTFIPFCFLKAFACTMIDFVLANRYDLIKWFINVKVNLFDAVMKPLDFALWTLASDCPSWSAL